MSHHGPMDAYSEDLRHKIVEAVQQRRMSKSEAARAFGVSRSSVKRYVKAVCEGRSLTLGIRPRARNPSSTRRPEGSLKRTSKSARSPSSQTGESTYRRLQGFR
jgi:transposase